MKFYADKKRKQATFKVEDSALLKLQPYAQSSLVNGLFPKLVMKYFGSYKVLEKIGKAVYKLDLPDSDRERFDQTQLRAYRVLVLGDKQVIVRGEMS